MPSQDDAWFKDAVFYEVPVRSYFDANGDGYGDFRGLSQKLDYIRDLGVDCIWVQPMYPSPLLDDGYDISGFLEIHPDLGTVNDFRNFVDAAHARGMKVISDLVLNHTSDQHPWFQEARSESGLPEARLLCLVRRPRCLQWRSGHFHRHRTLKLDLRSCGRAVFLAPVFLSST